MKAINLDSKAERVSSNGADEGIILEIVGDVAISGREISTFSTTNSNRKNPDSIPEPVVHKVDVTGKKLTVSSKETSTKSMQRVYDRKEKVAKMGYTDHGVHELITSLDETEKHNSHLGKKFSCSLEDVYDIQSSTTPEVKVTQSDKLNSTKNRESKKRGSPESGKETGDIEVRLTSEGNENGLSDASKKSYVDKEPKQDTQPSLLHAALQQQNSMNAGIHVMSTPNSRGKCLTNPSEGDSNYGLDNVEGNLILHENDLIRIPPSNIKIHKSKADAPNYTNLDKFKMTGFLVLGLLGQGTFAQVFKCRCVATGKLVALKIVKNKAAYTRQAAIEIDIFQALAKDIPERDSLDNLIYETEGRHTNKQSNLMVEMFCYFMHQSHMCLVFELLGKNLYEALKRRKFQGLSIDIVRDILKQAIEGVNELSQRNIVHCDVKPENILLVSDSAVQNLVHARDTANATSESKNLRQKESESNLPGGLQERNEIKLIDFGSARFEGETAHTYIQSRFYRSPEVLVGLDYDSAIDMWSLGCVAAELFLGLPILPGVHEHDQITRIYEMIGKMPDWMLDQGLKSKKHFVKRTGINRCKGGNPPFTPLSHISGKTSDFNHESPQDSWRLKTRKEFIDSLSVEEKLHGGGLSKHEQKPTNRYFKRKLLEDIVMLHGISCSSSGEKELLGLFVHLLKGMLNPDPCERWTAFQASTHPFITGNTSRIRRKRSDETAANRNTEGNNSIEPVAWDIYWKAPFDRAVCRRKLALREIRKGGTVRLGRNAASNDIEYSRSYQHPSSINTTRVTSLTGAMSLSHSYIHSPHRSPPPATSTISGSLRSPLQVENLSHGIQEPICNYITAASGLQFHHPVSILSHHQLASSFSHIHNCFDSSGMIPTPATIRDNTTDHNNHIVPILPIILGAQSFSGLYYDRINHDPAEGELGYALQRPGVVPNGHMGHMNPIIFQQNPSAIAISQPPSDLGYIGRPTNFTSLALNHFSPNVNPNILSGEGIHGTTPLTPGHDSRIRIPQDASPRHMARYPLSHEHEVPYNIN